MDQPHPTPPHPSELELHGHFLGTLAPPRAEVVAGHTLGCARCQGVLAALAQADGAWKGGAQARLLPAVEARAARGRRVRLWLLPMLASAAAVAGLLLVFGRRPADDLSPKGVGFQVHARRGDQALPLDGRTRLRAGDRIRFVVERPRELAHLLVLGVDATGAVTVYHPYGERDSALLPAEPGRFEIPDSVALDASPGPERIFALFSRAPLALARVEPALQALGRGGAQGLRVEARLPVEVDAQASVIFEKEQAP